MGRKTVGPVVSVDPKSVFLNVPFDAEYRPLFVALIAGLTALGLTPHCVVEVPSSGKNRLDRIYDLMASCGASLHDLSRISLSGPLQVPRFNMPFELGMAFSLSRKTEHRFFVLEEKAFRLQQSLSDLNGVDPQIHGSSVTGLLGCLLDSFESQGMRVPIIRELRELTDQTGEIMAGLQEERELTDPFSPAIFRQVVEAAVWLARTRGLVS